MWVVFLTSLAAGPAEVRQVPGVRTALVMGAWTGQEDLFPVLPGVEQDTAAMSAKLEALGFEVTLVKNPSSGQAKKAVDDFGKTLQARGGTALFYFSGHGAEHEGGNYLIPADTHISSPADLPDEALPVNRVLNAMQRAGTEVNMVFLDCCRNGLTKAATTTGLAPMEADRCLIGYATSAGRVAFAGKDGSPYTAVLAKHLGTPDVSLMDMLSLVTEEVATSSQAKGMRQVPALYSQLHGIYRFGGDRVSSTATTLKDSTPPPPPRSPPSVNRLPVFQPGQGTQVVR